MWYVNLYSNLTFQNKNCIPTEMGKIEKKKKKSTSFDSDTHTKIRPLVSFPDTYTWFQLHTTTDLSSSALRIISNLLSLLTKCILTKFSLNFCKDLLVVQLPKFLQYLQIVTCLSESVNKSQC